MRERLLAQAESRNTQLAAVMAGQLANELAQIDHALLILRGEWKAASARFDEQARAELSTLPEGAVSVLSVVDANGFIVYNSLGAGDTFVGDRPHFDKVRGAGDRLLVSPPLQTRLGQVWSVVLTRPVLRDGQFAGAVAALVPASHLLRQLTASRGAAGDIVTLLDAEGRIVGRSVDAKQSMGVGAPPDRPYMTDRSAAGGSYRTRSAVDGINRLYGWRRLPGTGLIMVVGMDEAAVLAPLDAALARNQLLSGTLSAMLGAFGFGIAILLLRLEREQRAAAAAQDLRLRLFESSHVAVAVVDADIRIVDCNPAAAALLGVAEPAAAIGRRASEFAPEKQPDGTPSAQGNYAAKALAEGTAVFEWRHQRPDGELWDGEVHMVRFEADGRVLVQCAMEDITERKRASRTVRLLEFALDKVGDELITCEGNGLIVGVNRQACEHLGMTADEVVGAHIWEIDPDFGPADAAALIEKLKTEQWTRFESRHQRRDGTTYPVEVTSSLVHLDGKDYSVAFSRDISERKSQERRLVEMNEVLEQRVQQRTAELLAAKSEAERANLAKSDFLSRMSHELRTPLNAILGFGQLMQLDLDPGTRNAGWVREILHAGKHLLDLINEVLDLSRVEAGAVTVSPEPVALQPMLIDCLTLLLPQAQAQGVQLPPEPSAASADCLALADRTRLKQVLLNLLSNAIKFTRRDGRVELSCVAVADSTPRRLRINVHDQGPGLTPQQRERLFRPFERLDADERRIEGTGIGLALSKRLVELMGGAIGVDSTPGVGSTFWIELRACEPAAPAPPSANARPTVQEAPTGGAPAAAQDLLCIEDNPANLLLLESVFARRAHIRLLTASTPGEGLELARTHRPALILLDINLPEMDGWAVMRCLRENDATRGIPVVAVTANATAADVERGKAAGFAAYVTKPLDVDRLLGEVDRLLAGPSPARQD